MPGISEYIYVAFRCQNAWGLAFVNGMKAMLTGGSIYFHNGYSCRLEMECGLAGNTLTYKRALEVRGGSINLDRIAINELVGLF